MTRWKHCNFIMKGAWISMGKGYRRLILALLLLLALGVAILLYGLTHPGDLPGTFHAIRCLPHG